MVSPRVRYPICTRGYWLTCRHVLSTAATTHGSGVSLFADKQFDEAYNTSLVENDLPHVRWGRIDYINVTYITSKWAVWKCVAFVPCFYY